jgi:hypothetical protein
LFRKPVVPYTLGRVIEIPTPRWTADAATRDGIQMCKEVRVTLQEHG